jgi:hypothetical protein
LCGQVILFKVYTVEAFMKHAVDEPNIACCVLSTVMIYDACTLLSCDNLLDNVATEMPHYMNTVIYTHIYIQLHKYHPFMHTVQQSHDGNM